MKKIMNFLAWILVVSMIVTTIPATQASVWAGTAYNEMDDSFEVFANRYYFEAVFGESVTMKVNAVKKDANTSIVSYQWYKEDEIIESATANTCTVTANGYDRNYHCVVTDSCGKEKIVRFTVVTRVGLEVTYDKAQYNVISGGSKTLAVTARTKVDGTVISYKWKMYDEINEDWIDIPEENKNAYTMSSITSNIKIRCTVVAKYTYKGEKLFSHTEQEDVDFEINVSHYGFNACGKANGYYAYVKVGEPVTYTVTADDGTIVAEYLDQITQEYKKIDSTRDSYTFTPKVSGITKFRTYIEEDEEESEDCFEQQIVVFDVAGDIIIGQTKIITPIQSEGKDVGYEFMTTQAGEYSIYTKYEMPLTIACEDGSVFCDNTYYDESTDSLYKVTLHLKANTKYYIIVSSDDGYWDKNQEWHDLETPYQFSIVSDTQCCHVNKNVNNAVVATCTTEGYTGEAVCSVCGQTIFVGAEVEALGHRTTVVNKKEATCITEGYTGDTVCSVCGEMVERGKVVEASGHRTTVVNRKAATVISDGYTGDEVCSVCGEKISDGKKIAKIKSITLSKEVLTYAGKNLKATVVVKDTDDKTVSPSNYQVTYSKDIKSIGIKVVKITFKGNYSGTKTLAYKIAPKNTSNITVKASVKSIKVSWKKQASQTSGYMIQYSTKKNFDDAKTVIIKKNSTTKTTIKLLKKGSTYYVRICTYKKVNKKNICSDWSSAKKVKVTK